MSKRFRISESALSYDVEENAGKDKNGKTMWRGIAFFRSKKVLLRYLVERNIPIDIKDMPDYHPDVAIKINKYVEGTIGPSPEKLAALKEARKSRWQRS